MSRSATAPPPRLHWLSRGLWVSRGLVVLLILAFATIRSATPARRSVQLIHAAASARRDAALVGSTPSSRQLRQSSKPCTDGEFTSGSEDDDLDPCAVAAVIASAALALYGPRAAPVVLRGAYGAHSAVALISSDLARGPPPFLS